MHRNLLTINRHSRDENAGLLDATIDVTSHGDEDAPFLEVDTY